ncbi:L-xylulose reductase [Diaporthe amygdali]|uniref:L-xylulose reductase n=1 Tax=Phomopsis amygdali TaxID=1214568 RepID=UPI0022FEBBC1|nr:L-xylulose reductase [Diaporthe amygdali]KAJ0108274.1 L-xylulose reductase [Diaporthe amygdali]
MEPIYQLLVDRIIHKWSEKPHDRILIALAGPPGSGKTTIARKVAQRLASSSSSTPAAPKTAVVSVDGFHMTLAALRALPNAEEALARRGAPWTFDADAAVALVRELRMSGPNSAGFSSRDVVVPTFDHAVKDPVEGGLLVPADAQVCILEGNYLLSDEGSWAAIMDIVDDRWLVKVDPALARARIAARHLAAGIEPTLELALARTDYNDLPNGDYVMKHSEGRSRSVSFEPRSSDDTVPSEIQRVIEKISIGNSRSQYSTEIDDMASNGTNGRTSTRAPNPPVQDSVFKQFRLDGRTVIVTGGAGGIGYEIARGLAEAGANLALWYHSSSKAEKLGATIAQEFGVKVQTYKVDVRQYDDVEKVVDQVVQDFGRLDVMIANAGVPSKAGGLDDKVEDWDRVRSIDFDGAYYCFRAAGLVFRKQGHGVGIATASMSGHAANVPQEQSCYNACKAGVIHLCKSLSVEWAKWGGRINSVSPGYIDTEISGDCPFEMKEEWFSLTPMRRDADPRELKGVYLYLASDASSYTTGADFVVDGGYTAR